MPASADKRTGTDQVRGGKGTPMKGLGDCSLLLSIIFRLTWKKRGQKTRSDEVLVGARGNKGMAQGGTPVRLDKRISSYCPVVAEDLDRGAAHTARPDVVNLGKKKRATKTLREGGKLTLRKTISQRRRVTSTTRGESNERNRKKQLRITASDFYYERRGRGSRGAQPRRKTRKIRT